MQQVINVTKTENIFENQHKPYLNWYGVSFGKIQKNPLHPKFFLIFSLKIFFFFCLFLTKNFYYRHLILTPPLEISLPVQVWKNHDTCDKKKSMHCCVFAWNFVQWLETVKIVFKAVALKKSLVELLSIVSVRIITKFYMLFHMVLAHFAKVDKFLKNCTTVKFNTTKEGWQTISPIVKRLSDFFWDQILPVDCYFC